jgi:hypothetical protein
MPRRLATIFLTLPSLGSNPAHRLQFGGSGLNDGSDLGSESPNRILRRDGSDAVDQDAAEVPLNPIDGPRRHGFHGTCLELQPVFLVPDPPALGNQPFPSRHGGQRPDERGLIPMPRCFNPQDTRRRSRRCER